jgi:EAL domain-containing protein (putative c-di-GMP-specific phosphodiesterase class I)
MFRLPERATLYLSKAALPQTTAVMNAVAGTGMPFGHSESDVITVDCTAEQIRRLCLVWSSSLSRAEQASIRCHVTETGQTPTTGELMHSRSLEHLVDFVEGQWLDELLAGNQLVTFFQPIIHNQRPFEIFAHECLVRGVESTGDMIPPLRLFNAARATGRVAKLDHASRLAAIQTCVEKNLQSRVFLNFNPRYLNNETTYLEETVRAILESHLDPDRFVFEVVESDEIQDVGRLLDIVDYCREVGCHVALDDMGTGYNSLYLMATVKPDFIKLDRDLIKDVETDTYKSRIAGKLIELARELRIKTVVEGIETRAALDWSVAQRAEYSQGFLFAKPQPEPLERIRWCDDYSQEAVLQS